MTPRATYRFQFHKGFPFADAEALVPYLDRLGISHVYASPITTAVPGSMHGYDVIDPTRINPELGGEPAFRSLVAALKARGMGVIIDIVPNHMGVAGGGNPWWNDVLAKGEASPFARFFDIDWRDRLVLPVLGAPLSEVIAARDIRVAREGSRAVLMLYGEQRLPIRDEDQADFGDLPALLDRQHYRLAFWRTANDDLNWRRFFTISELAGLRIEDPAVFEATHALYFRLHDEGLIDGVRVDHVDGLTDPAGYCRALRQRLGDDAYIVVEKILGPGERLATDWGIDGTSGYDFMETASALLHDPAGEAPLTDLWEDISGRPGDFAEEELQGRQDMLAWQFEGQLTRCVDAFAAIAPEGVTRGMLRRAIERLLWVFPVYRTYGTADGAPDSDAAIRDAVRDRVRRFIPPGEAKVIDLILGWLAGGDERTADAVRRFQQLSAPIAAKAVEDTAFYRYGRLLSRTDVGFDAMLFALPVAEVHKTIGDAAKDFPCRMLATATHDHKRGEDVRARLAVLSEVPGEWRETVTRWRATNAPFAAGIDPADEYMLYQTLIGAWPIDAERVIAWQQKALREAKLRSSWEAPDEAYEKRAAGLVEALLDPARSAVFLEDMERFVARLEAPARANSLVVTALRYTLPGVPDLYQGAELPDLSLVDPDNRRPVDYALRERLLADPDDPAGEKLQLIARLLAVRRAHPALFADGDYVPLAVSGARSAHVLAFARTAGDETLVCATALHCAPPLAGREAPIVPGDWWEDTRIAMPPECDIDPHARSLFAAGPVFYAIVP
jgi:(1->4)-alpha-D-glucan 1-alpha-D-glucosylmutase